MSYCWSAFAVPYYCGMNKTITTSDCLTKPENFDVTTLVDYTKTFASSGMIDWTFNMFNHRVFIWHGMNDTIAVPGHIPLYIFIHHQMVATHTQSKRMCV